MALSLQRESKWNSQYDLSPMNIEIIAATNFDFRSEIRKLWKSHLPTFFIRKLLVKILVTKNSHLKHKKKTNICL